MLIVVRRLVEIWMSDDSYSFEYDIFGPLVSFLIITYGIVDEYSARPSQSSCYTRTQDWVGLGPQPLRTPHRFHRFLPARPARKHPEITVLEETPIFHLPTGLLLTDICCLDFCLLDLDICWLRHLLISANLPFADSTWTFADPDICWSFLYPPIKTFADPDICWFYQKSDLLTFFL